MIENPEWTIHREQRWSEILRTYFKKIVQTRSSKKKDVVLVCGAAHLVGLLPRLICEGFKVDKVLQANEQQLYFTPISTQEKGLFFTCELEKKAFDDLKSQISKQKNKPTWVEEMVSLTNWNEWQQNYMKANTIKKGYEPGTLVKYKP